MNFGIVYCRKIGSFNLKVVLFFACIRLNVCLLCLWVVLKMVTLCAIIFLIECIHVMCLCTCAITYQVFDEMIVRVLFNHICRFGSCSDWGKFFLVEKCGNFKLPYLFDFHTWGWKKSGISTPSDLPVSFQMKIEVRKWIGIFFQLMDKEEVTLFQ